MFGYKIVKIINNNPTCSPPELDVRDLLKYTNETVERLETVICSLFDYLGLDYPNPYNKILKISKKEK